MELAEEIRYFFIIKFRFIIILQPVDVWTTAGYLQLICRFSYIICGYPKINDINPLDNLSNILIHPHAIYKNPKIIYGYAASIVNQLTDAFYQIIYIFKTDIAKTIN